MINCLRGSLVTCASRPTVTEIYLVYWVYLPVFSEFPHTFRSSARVWTHSHIANRSMKNRPTSPNRFTRAAQPALLNPRLPIYFQKPYDTCPYFKFRPLQIPTRCDSHYPLSLNQTSHVRSSQYPEEVAHSILPVRYRIWPISRPCNTSKIKAVCVEGQGGEPKLPIHRLVQVGALSLWSTSFCRFYPSWARDYPTATWFRGMIIVVNETVLRYRFHLAVYPFHSRFHGTALTEKGDESGIHVRASPTWSFWRSEVFVSIEETSVNMNSR